MGVITLRSDSERRRRATAALQRLRPVVAEEAEHALGRAEAVGFLARLDLWFLDLHGPLEALYGDDEADELVGRLVRLTLRAAAERPTELRETDRRREVEPRWYQEPRTVGYVTYTDRFCGTLAPGDALIHHCETIHYSGPNRSDRARCGLLLVYRGEHTKTDKEYRSRYDAAQKR